MDKINPNPNCLICAHHQLVHIDGYGELVGTHDMCIRQIENKPIGNLVPLAQYYNDEQCIDNFINRDGKCPYYVMDCNNCEHLNITEAEQKQRGNYIPHICTKYNQRVIHRATNKIHNEYIYPCDKCLKENNNGK